MSHDYDEYADDQPYVVIEKHSGGSGAFLLGLAAGAGLALLFAPQSGEQTRREIEARANKARRRAEDLANDVTGKVTDRINTARTQVEDRIDLAKGQIEMRKQQVSSAVEAGRSAAREARAELERRIAETKAAYQAGASAAREARHDIADAMSDAADEVAHPTTPADVRANASVRAASPSGGETQGL